MVRQFGPDGSVAEELVLPGGGDQPTDRPGRISWLISAPGEYRWTVAPRDPLGPGSFAIGLDEDRQAGACDESRLRAERALLAARLRLSQPGEESAARAAGLVKQAFDGWAEVGDREQTLATLFQMARVESHLQRIGGARDLYQRALVLARDLGDQRAQAHALQERAWFSPPAEQLDSLTTALELRRQLGEESGLAQSLFGLGVYYANRGETALALRSFRQALELQARNEDLRREAWTLGEIGAVHEDPALARAYLDFGIERGKAAGDVNAQAHVLQKSADLRLRVGELAEASDDYTRARRLLVAVGERAQAAWALTGAANAALYLGEPDKARQGYEDALKAFEVLHESAGRAAALLGIGAAFEAEGETTAALPYFQQGLEVSRDVGLPAMEALALYDLGKAHRQIGAPSQAIPELEEALALQADPTRRAQTLVELGKAHSQAGTISAAESAFQNAIQLSGRAELVEAAAQAGLARLDRDHGDLLAARSAIGRALEITEKLRAGLIRPDQRVTFLASRRSYYELYVDLLVQLDRSQPGAGYRAAALAVSEQARARGLLDLLVERRVDIRRGIPPRLKQRETDVGERIARLQTQLLSSASLRLPEAEVRRLRSEQAQAEEDEKELETEIRRGQAAYADMRAPRPLLLDQIQVLLDGHTALLEFFLGAEGSHLFVVTRQGLYTHALPPRSVIRKLVERSRSGASQDSRMRARDYAADASELYRQLLLPAIGELGDKSRLLIAPDGPLYSLSFEALLTSPVADADPNRRNLPYLIRERSVSYIPSASVLAQLLTERRPSGEAWREAKLFVGFADPEEGAPLHAAAAGRRTTPACPPAGAAAVGRSGERAVEAIDRMRGLPAARDEVCRIAGLFPPGQAVVFTGPEATEDNVKSSPLVTSARNLHFAAHGRLDEQHPELSGLVLAHATGSAEDGLLQVREIFNLELHADLVVLSACQSGLGREVSGEGLIGMTRAFLYAGAASIVVSLWAVDDESTADLMVRFYRHLRETGDTTEALRSAKLEMIDRSPYYHPYYWAPFILVGQP